MVCIASFVFCIFVASFSLNHIDILVEIVAWWNKIPNKMLPDLHCYTKVLDCWVEEILVLNLDQGLPSSFGAM